MNESDATRVVLWNIHYVWIMYALLVPMAATCGYGFYRRVKVWRRGASEHRFDRPLVRLGLVLRYAVLQLRTWAKLIPARSTR